MKIENFLERFSCISFLYILETLYVFSFSCISWIRFWNEPIFSLQMGVWWSNNIMQSIIFLQWQLGSRFQKYSSTAIRNLWMIWDPWYDLGLSLGSNFSDHNEKVWFSLLFYVPYIVHIIVWSIRHVI